MSSPPVKSPLHVLIIHRRDAREQYAEYLRSEGFLATEANDSNDGVAKAIASRRTSQPAVFP